MIKFYWRFETDLDLFGFRQIHSAKFIHPHFHLLTKENTAQMQEKDCRFSHGPSMN
jgi:hypothetical protein